MYVPHGRIDVREIVNLGEEKQTLEATINGDIFRKLALVHETTIKYIEEETEIRG
jgi:hypothetical protein